MSMTASSAPATSPGHVVAERRGRERFPSRPGARPLDLRRSRRPPRAARDRRLRRLLRLVRRYEGDAGGLSRSPRPHASPRACSWSAPIRTWWSSAATSWSIAPGRWPISMPSSAARCSMPASRTGRSMRGRSPWRKACGAGRSTSRACSPSATRFAPISPGRPRWASTFLFVTAGIHAEELGARENPDPTALREIFADGRRHADAVMRRLAW